jgi:autotransporter-associated beta strand protein
MRLIPTVEVGSGFNDKVTVSFSGAVGDLVWTGDIGPTFDLSNVNFSLNGSPEFFMTFDNVLFDDSALGSLNPTLNTTVMAGAVLLENQSNSYVFSGPGGFGGGTMLIKNGSGSVTLGTINTYTGPTIIGAGTMLMGAVNALPNGAGKSNVTVNGTLDLNSFNTTVNGLDGTGQVDNVALSTATLRVIPPVRSAGCCKIVVALSISPRPAPEHSRSRVRILTPA